LTSEASESPLLAMEAVEFKSLQLCRKLLNMSVHTFDPQPILQPTWDRDSSVKVCPT
jgi:hypothetical protein